MVLHQFPDTTYTFLDGSTAPKTLQVITSPLDPAKVGITYWVDTHAYWGVVWFIVKVFDPQGVPTFAWTTVNYKIPYDTDDDGIADGWEKENGGYLHLDSLKSDPDCTSAVPDTCWDMEETTQFTNTHDGDGITKLQEYQGVMIGSTHYRLSPTVKEIFIDTLEAEYAAWAAQQLETQLFLKAYLVAGAIGPNGSQSPAFPGTSQLRWLGENEATYANYRNYVKVKDDGHLRKQPRSSVDSLKNGFVVVAGRYWTGRRVTDPACTSNPWCAPVDSINGIQYGMTQGPIYKITKGEKASFSRIFDSTINGLLDVSTNSIPEATPLHYFFYPIADGRDTAWVSVYNGTDLDGGGFGLVNPLDLLSAAFSNDQVDAHSGGQDVSDIQRMTTLHELGHALGMGPGDTHDNTKPSPMVVGHGPFNVSTFRSQDKQEFRLK